jgi:hypothetical protein
MIRRPEYARTLFVFNDNEEQFGAFLEDPTSGPGCAPGGGNAAIRHHRCETPARAAGVPTGSRGEGYAELTDAVRTVIDEAIHVIRELLDTRLYDAIVYSASDESGALGTGIFRVGDDVKRYIVDELRRLARP